ncbi:MAG: SHOCT domain-containing protein [Gammaproteobacteria bacterium]|nr:SHOCT domain-containing protein [Gammaproteobacteria bacterium]
MFWILLLITVAVIALSLNQSDFFESENNISKQSKYPIEILNERYARGEVETSEYRKLKKELLN